MTGYRGCICDDEGMSRRYGPHLAHCPLFHVAICRDCEDGLPHRAHWTPRCTCAAAGFGISHSGHCDLWGTVLLVDDRLLLPVAEATPTDTVTLETT